MCDTALHSMKLCMYKISAHRCTHMHAHTRTDTHTHHTFGLKMKFTMSKLCYHICTHRHEHALHKHRYTNTHTHMHTYTHTHMHMPITTQSTNPNLDNTDHFQTTHCLGKLKFFCAKYILRMLAVLSHHVIDLPVSSYKKH